MDKDKNIHQETVTLDGERGGGRWGEVPPSLLLKVIWLLTAPFFTEEKKQKNLDHWKKRRYEWSSCVSFTILSY